MKEQRQLIWCAAGTAVTALCCFTPVLVVLLGAVGLSAWLGWLDYVLLPALIVFAGLTAIAWLRWTKARRRVAETTS